VRFALNAPFVTSFVTNWMTAAGIALIAGGLATLITFRTVLFGAGAGERRRAARASRRRRPAARPVAQPVAPQPVAPQPVAPQPVPQDADAAGPGPRSRRARGTRRRIPETAGSGGPAIAAPAEANLEDRRGGLASIGLADEEEPEAEELEVVEAAKDVEHVEEVEDVAPVQAREIDRYGDRVDGWVRPDYHDALPSGEYWTPVPIELAVEDGELEPSAKGYGWPVPVERLPPAPPYEPATGADLTPVPAEPTEVVPTWPPVADERESRVRLPRSWASRDEEPRDEKRRRPRPRPHPDAPADRSNVYVSRHAADRPD